MPTSRPDAATPFRILVLGDFGATLMIGGDIPGETQTASLAIYDGLQARHDVESAVMSGILTLVAIVILYSVNRLAGRKLDV